MAHNMPYLDIFGVLFFFSQKSSVCLSVMLCTILLIYVFIFISSFLLFILGLLCSSFSEFYYGNTNHWFLVFFFFLPVMKDARNQRNITTTQLEELSGCIINQDQIEALTDNISVWSYIKPGHIRAFGAF